MENIELKLDENNELIFDVNITGTDAPNVIPKFRFIFENNKISYGFAGTVVDGKVVVDVPIMKENVQEGKYPAHLEVLIDDRYFQPLDLDITFKNSLKVTAESVVVKNSSSDRLMNENLNATAQLVQAETARAHKNTVNINTPMQFKTLKEKFGK